MLPTKHVTSYHDTPLTHTHHNGPMYNGLTSIIDAIKNSLCRLVFRELMRLPARTHPFDDTASDPSVWPQIRDTFWEKSLSDFVTLNDNVDKNKKLLDKKMRAAIEGRSELSSENHSEQEYEPHAVRLTSQQMTACNSRRQRIPSTAATRLLHSSVAVYWNAAQSPPPSSLKSICLFFCFVLSSFIVCNDVIRHHNESFGRRAIQCAQLMSPWVPSSQVPSLDITDLG